MQLYMESRIVDEFEGWDGDAVYELDNGSKWELASYTYSYRYKYRPKAKIWRDGSKYLLEVDGMSGKKAVRRIY